METSKPARSYSDRVEFLDWLRALAVLLVVLGHSIRPIAPGGAVGVSVFFVLSGYLIASILLRDGMMTFGNIAKFIVRRIGRIYPMYVVQIAAVFAFFWFYRNEHIELVRSAVPSLLTFQGGPSAWLGYGFGVLWTLEVEFYFYLTFPFFLWFALATRNLFTCLALACTLSIAAKAFSFGGATLAYYDHFLIGSATVAAIRLDVVPAILKHRKGIFVGLALILAAAMVPATTNRDVFWYLQSLCAAVGTSIVIFSAHSNEPSFRIPSISFVGRISYSIYLVHAVVLDWYVKKYADLPSHIPLYIAVVLAISTVTYWLVEQPIIKLVHRFVKFSSKYKLATK